MKNSTCRRRQQFKKNKRTEQRLIRVQPPDCLVDVCGPGAAEVPREQRPRVFPCCRRTSGVQAAPAGHGVRPRSRGCHAPPCRHPRHREVNSRRACRTRPAGRNSIKHGAGFHLVCPGGLQRGRCAAEDAQRGWDPGVARYLQPVPGVDWRAKIRGAISSDALAPHRLRRPRPHDLSQRYTQPILWRTKGGHCRRQCPGEK